LLEYNTLKEKSFGKLKCIIPVILQSHNLRNTSKNMEGLADLLGEDPRLAPDIYFRVIEEVIVNGIPQKKTELIGAHKFVLAMLSDVFKTMFFGPMRDENEEIDINGTTIEAFKEFLNILYSLHTSSFETSVIEVKPLFEILDLCKRYMVLSAVTLIEAKISSTEFETLEPESVITAAIVANKYKELVGFETISGTFLQCCSAFLNQSFTTVHQVRQFLARVETRFSDEIVALMVRLLALTDCSNCKAPSCLHGCQVTEKNIVDGVRVKVWLGEDDDDDELESEEDDSDTVGEDSFEELREDDGKCLIAEITGYDMETGLLIKRPKDEPIVGEMIMIDSITFVVICKDHKECFPYSDVFSLNKDKIHFQCKGQ